MCYREKVYESARGVVGLRAVMESMIPNCRIHSGVIDVWASLLNDLERFKNHTVASRFIFPCSLMV